MARIGDYKKNPRYFRDMARARYARTHPDVRAVSREERFLRQEARLARERLSQLLPPSSFDVFDRILKRERAREAARRYYHTHKAPVTQPRYMVSTHRVQESLGRIRRLLDETPLSQEIREKSWEAILTIFRTSIRREYDSSSL